MSIVDSLSIIAAVAAAVERIIEIIKPIYLKLRNRIMKTDLSECTKAEKIMLSIFMGITICIILQIGIDLPAVNEPAFVQQLLAGLLSSLGSNLLHILLSILTGLKNVTESHISYRRSNSAVSDDR